MISRFNVEDLLKVVEEKCLLQWNLFLLHELPVNLASLNPGQEVRGHSDDGGGVLVWTGIVLYKFSLCNINSLFLRQMMAAAAWILASRTSILFSS